MTRILTKRSATSTAYDRRTFTILLRILVAVCVNAGCRGSTSASPSIRAAVDRAKREGRTSATITQTEYDFGAGLGLDALVRIYSSVLASPIGPSITWVDDGIHTWRSFHIDRSIAMRPGTPSFPPCPTAIPRSVSHDGDHFALPLATGSAVIDGVSVIMRTPDSQISFIPGRTYLIFGKVCPDGVFRLPYGPTVVFNVDPAGRITSQSASRPPFVKELLTLGTVPALEAHIRGLALSKGSQ